jgi:cell division protein FtsI (penicillin-binding protein 3)
LRGVPGKKRYLKDLNGEAIRDIGVVESAEPGRKLPLSIDLRLQFMQHRELKRTIAETGAAAASAVTVDAWTGEVLAMTNYPVFNPNNRADIDWAASRNRALTDEFEPGSTMKPLTLVAALESGQYGIDSIIDTSPGRIRVGSKVQHDPLNYGPISLSRVIEKSSQVGVTKVAQAIGHEAILDVFARFGLGAPTSIGFPGERTGSLPEHDYWSEIDKVTVAFGYSLTATPLQLAQAYAVFANRGERVPLTFLRRESESRVPGERVVTPEVAEQVVEVLHGVTADDATGHKARVDGYEVGGKTGTVHKVGNGQYLDNEYVALFVGVAPVEQPRYVTAVVIDRPKGDAYGGGAVAAPLYSRITEGVLRLRNIVPMLPEPLSAEAAVAALGGDQ